MSRKKEEIPWPVLVTQVAGLKIKRHSEREIAAELCITRALVRNVIASADYDKRLQEIADNATKEIVLEVKPELRAMAPLFVQNLKTNLEAGRIEAARLYAEITGLREKEQVKQGDASLTVIMPGAEAPKEKSVTVEVVSDNFQDET